jgi:sodium transport system permease protein
MRPRIIWTIFRKEITEALRDRVTLLVLVGLPLVFYPVMFVTTSQVTEHRALVVDRRVSTVAVWGVGASPLLDWLAPTNNRLKLEPWQGIPASLRRELEAGRLPPAQPGHPPLLPRELRLGLGRPPPKATAEPEDAVLRAAREVVSSKQADAVMIVWPGFDEALRRQDRGRVSVYYDSVIPESAQTWSRLSDHLGQFRQHVVKERQRERGLPEGFLTPLEVQQDDIAPLQRQIGNILGQALPLLLILLSSMGAMIAAIDMTAGEKERATMQTLLCAPVHSLEIVGGKFLAVWTVSLVSTLANIAGIGFTIGRVAAAFHLEVVHLGTLLAVLALLLPATWTIAALFLGVAVLARDAKDAGNFLSEMMLVMMLPVAASFLPGVELDASTSCVPLLNLCLLIRALMTGGVATRLIFLTLLSSLAYAGLALALAARAFGREQILLGGPFSWRRLLRRDPKRPATPTPSLVLTLFPVVFAGLFYLSLCLVKYGMLVMLLVPEYGVLLLPVIALAVARKFPLVQTFSLRRPHWRSLLGSALIGLTASTAVAGLVLRLAPPPDSMLRELQEFLQLGSKPAPLWELWLILALTPALCEETFFRGLMLSGLRRWGPWAAIGVSALLFGLLHGSIYQLLPTFILGLMLGYAVWRSGSLYCSILIHVLNNGLIATLVWSSAGKDLNVQAIPWSLTLGALAVMGIGLALLTGPKPRLEPRPLDP